MSQHVAVPFGESLVVQGAADVVVPDRVAAFEWLGGGGVESVVEDRFDATVAVNCGWRAPVRRPLPCGRRRSTWPGAGARGRSGRPAGDAGRR